MILKDYTQFLKMRMNNAGYKSVIAARLMCWGGSSYPQVETGG